METNKRLLNFHINNLSYSLDISSLDFHDELEKHLLARLPQGQHIDTKTLILLYIQQINEFLEYKNQLNPLIEKLQEYEKNS